MKFILIFLLGFVFAVPIKAQKTQATECEIDLIPVESALERASTDDIEVALTAIRDARVALETIESVCANSSTVTVGERRSNPAPLGDRKSFVTSLGMPISVQVVGVETGATANNLVGLDPDDGNTFIIVEVNIYCETDTDSMCEVGSLLFNAVGSNAVSYTASYSMRLETLGYTSYANLFGGGEGTIYIPFQVSSDDTDLVLYYDGYPDSVFFALE